MFSEAADSRPSVGQNNEVCHYNGGSKSYVKEPAPMEKLCYLVQVSSNQLSLLCIDGI